MFQRTYATDFDSAWKAVQDALKNCPFDVANRESGYLQTKWVDGTRERSLTEDYGLADGILKAQHRFRINVAREFIRGAQAIKISIRLEAMVQIDILEGWRPEPSDSVLEKTLLYRIGRIIAMQSALRRLDEQKANAKLNDLGISDPASSE